MRNNDKEKKYKVFISSAHEDLKEERAAVRQTLLGLGCIPVGMEQFPAGDMDRTEYLKKQLEACDYFILILGGRYGAADETDGAGFAETEYDYAVAKGIPVMSFLAEDTGYPPGDKREKTKAGRAASEKFHGKVSGGKMIRKYSSKEDLQTKVIVSLVCCMEDCSAAGAVRGEKTPPDSERTIRMLDDYLESHYIDSTDADEWPDD